MAKFVKIDESKLPYPIWLFSNIDDLVKNSKPETVGRAVKAIFSGEPGNIDGRPLNANEFALYSAFLYCLRNSNLQHIEFRSREGR